MFLRTVEAYLENALMCFSEEGLCQLKYRCVKTEMCCNECYNMARIVIAAEYWLIRE